MELIACVNGSLLVIEKWQFFKLLDTTQTMNLSIHIPLLLGRKNTMQSHRIRWEKQFITWFGRRWDYVMDMGKRFGKESSEAYALRPLEND